ncbi:MAG: FlgD immunoglobulin-like domain containing protein [Candidatus Krumholzibacteriia bacterium]
MRAPGDTLFLYGGPGTLEGTFQTAGGAPDRQGWIGLDLTLPEPSHFHASTYQAANLDPATPDNHAWYVGDETIPSCDPEDPVGGYGNGWNDSLTWSWPVPDAAQPVSVRVTAGLNVDTEPGYDILQFQVHRGSGWDDLDSFDGLHTGLALDVQTTVDPADYLDGAVHLRWVFTSDDGGWSDEDCRYPTAGAAQIDRIAVTFDQGAGPALAGALETVEPGTDLQWVPSSPLAGSGGVGDFSKVWPQLGDLDPCRDNTTPQFAFIDDGEVVPGTGGSPCQSWCYGPGGWVVNTTGGLLNEPTELHNAVESPPIALPPDLQARIELAFDAYTHNLLGSAPGCDEIFWFWELASTSDPAGETGWMTDSDGFLHYGSPGYDRHVNDVTHLLVPDARWLKVRLGVREFDQNWCWGGDVSPAPYFDNVAVRAVEPSGPQLIADPSQLAPDAFPASGTVDRVDLGANHVRFDAAEGGRDAVQVVTRPSLPERTLDGPPVMHYRLFANPLFDLHRTAGLPMEGAVPGAPVMHATESDSFSFDLPDSGFLFPGDVLRIWFTASETVGGTVLTTILPADTTGLSDPDAWQLYPEEFTVRALPSLAVAGEDVGQPATLLWLEAAPDDPSAWYYGMSFAGMAIGSQYDLYVGQSPEGAGLGTDATAAQLERYTAIVYSSLGQGADGVSPVLDRDDLGLLSTWLAAGNHGLAMFGDGLLSELSGAPEGQTFLAEWLPVEAADQDLVTLTGQSAPLVATLDGAPVFPTPETWYLNLGCPWQRVVSAVTPQPGTTAQAEFLGPDGQAGAYPYAAALLAEHDLTAAKVIAFPYDLRAVRDADAWSEPVPPVRGRILRDILITLGTMPSPIEVSAETPPAFQVAAHPNPFNPRVTVHYVLPHAGRLEVRMYDVRGRLVATLHESDAPAGPGEVSWAGHDRAGHNVSAGLYFCEVKAPGHTEVLKLTLVR